MKDEETQKLIDEVMKQHALYCAYNESFKCYYTGNDSQVNLSMTIEETEPVFMNKKDCQRFVDEWNQCKGGRWELQSKAQYNNWKACNER